MDPKYIEELADLADPGQLWRLPGLQQLDLPPEKRAQLDTGVALRRYAGERRRLLDMLGTGKSLLITPLSPNGVATKTVATPESHLRLMRVEYRGEA